MPVTDTLKTAADLKLAGFPDKQATVLAEKFEETATAISEDLKSFIRRELNELRLEMDRKLSDLRNELRVELHSSLRDQTFKLMAILIAALSVAVAIIKLFPNAH